MTSGVYIQLLPSHTHLDISRISQKKHDSLQTYSFRIYPSLSALIPHLDNDSIFIWRSLLYTFCFLTLTTQYMDMHTYTHIHTHTHTHTHSFTHPIYSVGACVSHHQLLPHLASVVQKPLSWSPDFPLTHIQSICYTTVSITITKEN